MDRSYATAGELLGALTLGALLLLIGLAVGWWIQWGGRGAVQGGGQGGGTGVAYATISLTCGSQTFNLSTGNSKGNCQNGNPPTTSLCTDGQGNEARASCDGGCSSSSGSGSCLAARQ